MPTTRSLLLALGACATLLLLTGWSDPRVEARAQAGSAAKVGNPITGEGLPNPAPKVKVPVADFEKLPPNPRLELIIARHGGHCGFLKNWKMESIAEDLIADRFLAVAGS